MLCNTEIFSTSGPSQDPHRHVGSTPSLSVSAHIQAGRVLWPASLASMAISLLRCQASVVSWSQRAFVHPGASCMAVITGDCSLAAPAVRFCSFEKGLCKQLLQQNP